MQAKLAISNVRDPLTGRFVSLKKICAQVVTVSEVAHVDLIVHREGGPYQRVRMDLEAAKVIAEDLDNAILRAMKGAVAMQTKMKSIWRDFKNAQHDAPAAYLNDTGEGAWYVRMKNGSVTGPWASRELAREIARHEK